MSLGRFISCSAQRCLPFYQALKARKQFQCGEGYQIAFQGMEIFLSITPLLNTPREGEILYLCLSITTETISLALVRDHHREQFPIYYTSQVLKRVETNYLALEKLAYVVLSASRKLRPYFEANTIKIRSIYPLRKLLHRLDIASRLTEWAV